MLNKKVKIFSIILLVVLVIAVSIFSLLYFKFGLREYFEVKAAINEIAPSLQNKAKNEFYSIATDVQYDQYGGIIAYVNTGENPGIAIWGKDGLRYFESYSDTVYSFYTLCTEKNIESIKFQQSYKILPTITTDISKWSKKAHVGRSVAIEIADGKNVGRIREAKSSDWYQFLPVKPYLLCVDK